MAASAALPHIEINGNMYAAHPNPSLKEKDGTDRTWLGHVVEYLSSSNGSFRLLQLLDRLSKSAAMAFATINSTLAAYFSEVADKFSVAWCMLSLPRIPEVTKKAWEVITDWSSDPKGPLANSMRKTVGAVHDIADAAAMWLYSGSMVLGSMALKNAGDVPNLVADVADLTAAASDWNAASQHLTHINAKEPENEPMQQRFMDTMREALIRLVKSVASVVSGVLGLLVLAFGGPVLSPMILLGISLTSTLAAISSHFFRETMAYEKVDFHKIRQPEVLIQSQGQTKVAY